MLEHATTTLVFRPEDDGAQWGEAMSVLRELADACALRQPPHYTSRDLRDSLRAKGCVLTLTYDGNGYVRLVVTAR